MARTEDTERVAWDTVTILESWALNLQSMEWDVVLEPTRSRGRTIRNLTVNTFHPFELLPGAFESGRFDWYPERDDERERGLTDMALLREYVSDVLTGWQRFLFERAEELAEADHMVSGPRGELTYAALLESQRWHAAWHHRQVDDHCRRRGAATPNPLSASLSGAVGLPSYIY